MTNGWHWPWQHRWEETERFSVPAPEKLSFDRTTWSPAEVLQLMYGMTTILYRCPCGEVKTIEIVGHSKKGE